MFEYTAQKYARPLRNIIKNANKKLIISEHPEPIFYDHGIVAPFDALTISEMVNKFHVTYFIIFAFFFANKRH